MRLVDEQGPNIRRRIMVFLALTFVLVWIFATPLEEIISEILKKLL
jgi:hypothetical protein